MTLHPQFVTDQKGHKKAVILPYKEYKGIMDDLEELSYIRIYDEEKDAKTPVVDIEKAIDEPEAKKKRK